MASAIEALSDLNLSEDEIKLVEEIAINFEFLERFFEEAEKSPARLKTIPEFPLPTLAVPYELATMYSLRALKLAEGAALLIAKRQYTSTFPVLRSLYEVWAAVTYAHVRFRALVVEGNNWAQFDQIAARLILGTTSHADTPNVIHIGHLLNDAKTHMVAYLTEDGEEAEVLRQTLDEAYATLSDGAHPTQFGLLPHAKHRTDALGVIWKREAVDETLRKPLLFDLHFGLRLVREFVPHLRSTADEIDLAARRGPMQNDQIRATTIQALGRLLEDEQLAPGSAERISKVVDYLKSGPVSSNLPDRGD